ncbi:MAG: metal-dependent phosphohydrolase [Leptolyngbya sp. SIO4C5]|uniref:Npun_R2479 family HD domain-containing metalloprotein n=1 Tax=Sphaerothrix gracilis TaxID=3151835 RepID=UPI0013C2941C|nr:metal-dependent phosphohydrolase [Leptolyngbya sp. SIO4C5]
MLNPNQLLIDAFVEKIRAGYSATYGGLNASYADIIAWVGNMGVENIANSNALYHNPEHTVLVTLVGQEILRGKHIREGGVSCSDWLHFLISLICHDIGYVKGVCRQDFVNKRIYATGKGDETVTLPPGSTDASLTPYHVDRGKLFIQERFGGHQLIRTATIQANIELTRFPVPLDSDHQDTVDYPGLVRAADLIGQLSDPRYLQKIPALFYEFEETGVNQQLGYKTPEDLRLNYPRFYWKTVYPYIIDAIAYLQLTQEGKQILANLYAHVFEVEHENHRQPL